MGYHHVDPDELEPLSGRSAEAVSIADAVDHLVLGSRRYVAEPGEQLPLAYHVHSRQEELFYVVEGEMHVETPDDEFVVPAGDVFAVEPGNPHRGFNPEDAGETLRVFAVGTPSVDDASPYDE